MDNDSPQERRKKKNKIFKIRSGGVRTHACAWRRSTLLKMLYFKGLYLACLIELNNDFWLIFDDNSRFFGKDSFLKTLLRILAAVYFEGHFLKRPRLINLRNYFFESMVYHLLFSDFRGNFLQYFLDFN